MASRNDRINAAFDNRGSARKERTAKQEIINVPNINDNYVISVAKVIRRYHKTAAWLREMGRERECKIYLFQAECLNLGMNFLGTAKDVEYEHIKSYTQPTNPNSREFKLHKIAEILNAKQTEDLARILARFPKAAHIVSNRNRQVYGSGSKVRPAADILRDIQAKQFQQRFQEANLRDELLLGYA